MKSRMKFTPKYQEGQLVLHKLDRRRMIIYTVLDLPNANDQKYFCRYIIEDNHFVTDTFKECELTECEDIL